MATASDGTGYAATAALREWYREGDAEELEYVAAQAAATAALALLAADEAAPRRRAVLAVEVDDAEARPREAPAEVTLSASVPIRAWASALVDDTDAQPVVAAAVANLAAAASGDKDARFALDEAAAHELNWYAIQELPDLLG
jgi:hypothetical protein